MPFVVVIEAGEPDQVFELLTLGAADIISAPLTTFKVLPRVWRLTGARDQEENVSVALKEQLGLRKLVGKSHIFLSLIE